MTREPPIKAGDLLYTVGPGRHVPHSPRDLRVYNTVVERVRWEGSYSEHATPADFASAVLAIELGDDRPILGFPQWIYRDHDVGNKVHRSAAGALLDFFERARRERDVAERALGRANEVLEWAREAVADQAVADQAVTDQAKEAP